LFPSNEKHRTRFTRFAAGTGEVYELAREMDQLALLIAKGALADTGLSLSSTRVAQVLGMSVRGALFKVDNLAVREFTRQGAAKAIDRLAIREIANGSRV
jgi:hypothetical protein